MGDTLHIIQVKSGGLAVPLQVMMVFVLFIYIYILWSYLSFFKFRFAKKLEKQAKNRYFDITANLQY